ncbi:MAG: hypothetical protein WDO56_28115 [Gammaproteobacteria bacterium]
MTDPNLTERNRDAQEARLERLIHGVLRSQPDRRAPASLEARVFAHIEEQALPWWRTGFSQWPMTARAALFAALLLITKLTLDLVMWLFSSPTPVAQTVESSVTWARSTASLFRSLLLLCQSLFDVIPAHWITLGLAFAAGMYVVLFVLSATAYRTLYLNK